MATSAALRIRPGARFTCHADGLCCATIHALGPVAGPELVQLRRRAPEAVRWHLDFHTYMMATTAQHCVFLRRDRLCAVHARFGLEAKPATCRKFPLGITATPQGRRVTTAHRCPCRTLGERAPLDPAAVDRELRRPGQPLRSDRRAPARMPVAPGRRTSFARYAHLEARLLRRLARGDEALAVLRARPFAPLRGTSWSEVADELREPPEVGEGSFYDRMRAWVGDALAHLVLGQAWPTRARPWRRYFDRSEARSPRVDDPEAMLNDWLADELWSLEWLRHGDLARARRDWACRVALLRALTTRLRTLGVRRDRAMAEALMMIDAVCTAEHWDAVADGLRHATRRV